MPDVLTWSFPLPRPHTGIALGNGRQGVLVWGVDSLHLTIARNGFWDHRGGGPLATAVTYAGLRTLLDAGDEAAVRRLFASPQSSTGQPTRPQQLGGGRLEISFASGWRPADATLILATGTVEITLAGPDGQSAICRLRHAMDVDVCWLELPAACQPATLRFRPQWEWVGTTLAALGITAPTMTAEADGGSCLQRLPADDAQAIVWRRHGAQVVLSSALGPEPLAAAIELARQSDLGRLSRNLATWWTAYWRTVPSLQLGEPALERLHTYGLVKQAGLTTPGGIAATLQGPWMEEDQLAPWSNDYHFNINLQLIYWPALSTGCWDHFQPLWDLLRSWIPRLREYGRRFFQVDDALMLPHATDDRGHVVGTFWHGTIDHASTAWMAQLAWLHHRYSGDAAILAEVAWPLLTGAFAGFWAMAEERPGDDGRPRLSLPLSVSPEYGEGAPGTWGRDASFQLAAFRCVAGILPQAAALLGKPIDPRWATALERLPPYSRTPIVGCSPPRSHIAVWEGQPLAFSHRHHSHLAGIWPFATIAPSDQQGIAEVDHSLHHWQSLGAGGWCAWCLPWAAIICARSDRPDAALAWLHWLEETSLNEGGSLSAGGTWGAIGPWGGRDWASRGVGQEIMQLDANLAVITAVHELLVQCHGDTIRIGARLPWRWRTLRFERIRAEGGFSIDGVVEGGILRRVSVSGRPGVSVILELPGQAWIVNGKCVSTAIQLPSIPFGRALHGSRIAATIPASGLLVLDRPA